jgi:molybdate transport system substrate-binding protein
VYERVRDKFVLGENISQAAQFAQSGNADAGIVALSLALAPAMKNSGVYFEIPETFHPPIAQAAVIVSATSQRDLAQRFLDVMKSPDSARILQSYGFAIPSARR